MVTSAEQPLDWIKQVERLLFDLEEKPQFGLPASFNQEQLEKRLQDLFGRPKLKVGVHTKGWLKEEERWKGLGEDLLPLKIEWTPLETPSYFVTTEQDLKGLMANLLGGEKEAAYFYDLSLVEGFYRYFAAEVLHSLEEVQFAPPLAPRMGEAPDEIEGAFGSAPCFVIDLSLQVNKQTFWGRILLSEPFRRDWKQFFVNRPPPSLSPEMQEKINVDLSMEVGHTRLSLAEWKGVGKGDFVLLDHCSYDPIDKKGGLVLSFEQKPLFRARFKDKGIKLTDYPNYEEVSLTMDEEMYDEESSEEFDDEGEDLYGDEPEREEFSEEEEVIDAELAPAESAIKPDELPINLIVEVGRLRMTAKELMELAPGNLLDINVAPEQGVDLVINGKKVGRGELIRLGETLGVRILSL